ncbi:hypothetical protein CENA302_06865 [Cylindrospermopsis raciborskii CENA302]|uniref:Uncharacterized protein n=1 Tax=Cylindrospermopsis raciborskii CENA302 TaxID=1170768 RepID=A0A9Q5QXF5_9CYAN|nr:hypothetical protein CENA302_06865 [Cylindrospermopsis raciborskii CENA302]
MRSLGKGVFKNSPPGRVSSQLTLRVFQVAAVRGDSNPLILSEGMHTPPHKSCYSKLNRLSQYQSEWEV